MAVTFRVGAIALAAKGDILTSDEFRTSVADGFHVRAASFAEAKASVRTRRAKSK